MQQDWRGNTVTASTPATVEGIDRFVQGLLGYEMGASAIIAAADNDPDSPLANAYAAMFYMFLENSAAPRKAAPYLARAEAAAARAATAHERLVVTAARAWIGNDIPAALAAGEALAEEHPRDLACAKVTQYHCFNLGDDAGLLRIGSKARDANPDVPHVHGMVAFGYEQSHQLAAAEASARRAVAMQRKEPWAHHAIAHVLLTQGRNAEGLAFLDDVSETWTGLNSFMFTHNWWHMALFLIELGEFQRILDFYDGRIWGVWKDYSQDQINAVSLLARLELAGVDVGDRWQDVADRLLARVDDHVQPFLSMQYLYGLARAGRPQADAMLASIRAYAPTAPAFLRPAWVEVCVPACEGLLAHARGELARATDRLGEVLPRLQEIGGSHAQRDLFERILRDARQRRRAAA